MARTLTQIKTEISTRIQSKEYLPIFITRSEDFVSFADTIGEFIAPYIKQLEDFLDIWTDATLLRNFLLKRNMFLNGSENLIVLQTIAQDRLKILSRRGTVNMLAEIQRFVNEVANTTIIHKDIGTVGWVATVTSPCYRLSSTALSYSYSNLRKAIAFIIQNETKSLTNKDIKNILKFYFEPGHIKTLYEFI